MFIFSKEPTCSVCGEKCDFPKFKLKNEEWLCQDCLKDAGLSFSSSVNKMTSLDIKEKITKQVEDTNAAVKMYKYAVENGFGRGFNENWGIKHFLVVQKQLLPEENVLMTFIGIHNYISTTKHDKHFAYALTNKRFIMAQKQTISGEIIQTIYLDNINDITFKSGILGGVITIDTIKEVFNVYLEKESAKATNNRILDILHELKNKKCTPASTNSSFAGVTSTADEILKFKNLLDSGIITEDEFNKKKQMLLNL